MIKKNSFDFQNVGYDLKVGHGVKICSSMDWRIV